MSLVTYTNYTNYKPVANLNAKVKRLIKKTKKVEEKPEFRFFPRNAHKRIKLPPPTFNLKEEAEKVKKIMEKRTPEDEESIRLHDESAAYAVKKYIAEKLARQLKEGLPKGFFDKAMKADDEKVNEKYMPQMKSDTDKMDQSDALLDDPI